MVVLGGAGFEFLGNCPAGGFWLPSGGVLLFWSGVVY